MKSPYEKAKNRKIGLDAISLFDIFGHDLRLLASSEHGFAFKNSSDGGCEHTDNCGAVVALSKEGKDGGRAQERYERT